jgi:glucose-6-phosphate isomerase
MVMTFNTGLDLQPVAAPLGFRYGPDCFGPPVEIRTLDSIRPSLRDPACTGPREVYAIAMDVGHPADRPALLKRNLLFGVVTYAAGRLGREPVRSQGHIHKPSPRNGWSTPELYEIWSGRAVILMQETAQDHPGRCFAVEAGPGDVVLVPPGWAHATISADPDRPLTFGAWCDRDYGFLYDDVRAHGGLAWFPLLEADGSLRWEANPAYQCSTLERKSPRIYAEFGVDPAVPLYRQFQQDHDRFLFVPEPARARALWENFVP